MSTGGAGGGGPTVLHEEELEMSEEQYRANVRQMMDETNADTIRRLDEMRRLYGDAEAAAAARKASTGAGEAAGGADDEGEAPFKTVAPDTVLAWMHSYYRSPHPEFVIAAMVSVCMSPEMNVATEASSAQFFAALLQGLKDDKVIDICSRACMVNGIRSDFLLSVLHQTGTVAAATWAERLQATLESNAPGSYPAKWGAELAMAASDLGSSGGNSILDWAIPIQDVAAFRAAEAWDAAGIGGSAPPPTDFECTGALRSAKQQLRADAYAEGATPADAEAKFNDWLMLSTNVLVDSLWCGYFATGDAAYIKRVLEVTLPLAPHLGELDFEVLVSMDSKLPESVTEGLDSAQVVAVRMARYAAWTTMLHSRVHAGVTRAIADEVGDLGELFVAPAYRNPMAAAAALPLAAERAAMLPTLLHVVSRLGLMELDKEE